MPGIYWWTEHGVQMGRLGEYYASIRDYAIDFQKKQGWDLVGYWHDGSGSGVSSHCTELWHTDDLKNVVKWHERRLTIEQWTGKAPLPAGTPRVPAKVSAFWNEVIVPPLLHKLLIPAPFVAGRSKFGLEGKRPAGMKEAKSSDGVYWITEHSVRAGTLGKYYETIRDYAIPWQKTQGWELVGYWHDAIGSGQSNYCTEIWYSESFNSVAAWHDRRPTIEQMMGKDPRAGRAPGIVPDKIFAFWNDVIPHPLKSRLLTLAPFVEGRSKFGLR